VLAINIERAPRHFRTENSAQFSTGPSDSIAISGARQSQYWPANARFFVIAGRENVEIETAWRMMQSAANSSLTKFPDTQGKYWEFPRLVLQYLYDRREKHRFDEHLASISLFKLNREFIPSNMSGTQRD
jgi:hypothetical protein